MEIRLFPIHKIFLAECLLQLERHEEATVLLAEVEINDLSNSELIDYAFVTAGVAIEAGNQDRLEASRTLLKELSISEPVFRERRDSIRLNIHEAISSGSSKPLMIRTKRLLANMVHSASTYLILKPTFMGVGIDIGKLVENHLPKRDPSPQQPSDKSKVVSPNVSSRKKK